MLKEKSPVVAGAAVVVGAVAAVVVGARGRRSGAGLASVFRGRFRSGAAVVFRSGVWYDPGPLPSHSFYFIPAAVLLSLLPSSGAGMDYGGKAAAASVFRCCCRRGRFRFRLPGARGRPLPLSWYISRYDCVYRQISFDTLLSFSGRGFPGAGASVFPAAVFRPGAASGASDIFRGRCCRLPSWYHFRPGAAAISE